MLFHLDEMAAWNYPDLILTKLKAGNIWKISISNFFILNIIYFLHNIIENRGSEILKHTIYDQLSLLVYYFLVILLVTGLFKLLKIHHSIFSFAQYLLATSVIFSTLYIIDIPVLLLGYNFDKFFSFIEFTIYLWISWELIKDLSPLKKKYFVLLCMMCVFYFTIVLYIVLYGLHSMLYYLI